MTTTDNALTPALVALASRRTRSQMLPDTAASIRRARVFTAHVLNEWAPPIDADAVRLCVSELCTNALQHGRTPGRLFLLRLSLTDAEFLVEVHDADPVSPELCDAAPTDEAGRWGTCPRRGPGKVVWCGFPLASPYPGEASS